MCCFVIGMRHRHRPEARPIMQKLVEWADVLCENFKPGTLDKFGYDYETCSVSARAVLQNSLHLTQNSSFLKHNPSFLIHNSPFLIQKSSFSRRSSTVHGRVRQFALRLQGWNPALIYTTNSGFGRFGSYSPNPAYDLVVQGFSGMMHAQGNHTRNPHNLSRRDTEDRLRVCKGAAQATNPSRKPPDILPLFRPSFRPSFLDVFWQSSCGVDCLAFVCSVEWAASDEIGAMSYVQGVLVRLHTTATTANFD